MITKKFFIIFILIFFNLESQYNAKFLQKKYKNKKLKNILKIKFNIKRFIPVDLIKIYSLFFLEKIEKFI